MLAVRDYNLIIDSMNNNEKKLFKENLKIINESLYRGTKILSWGTKSLLDNFIKDVRNKCSNLYMKLNQMKQGIQKINKLI